MDYKKIKTQIHEALVLELETQVERFSKILVAIQESKNNDTKSSAGDKFETGREMMQIELDKTEGQLHKVNYSLEILNQIRDVELTDNIALGSLVLCNTGVYYLSIGHGKVMIDGVKYYAISPASPIGQLLLHRAESETVTFNTKKIEILKIH